MIIQEPMCSRGPRILLEKWIYQVLRTIWLYRCRMCRQCPINPDNTNNVRHG